MDEQKAREILGESITDPALDDKSYILAPGGFHFMSWKKGSITITLDSEFCVEELEAIVWWMKNKGMGKDV
jgi:hypothetical protein